MLHAVFEQCLDKLEPGGRIAVNVANLGRKPYRSLSRDVIDILEGLGYLLRGEIIWRKSQAAGGSCAWGTYQRPGNPVLRDISERIVVACKGRFDRALTPVERAERGLPCEGTITMDEFIDATLDVWDLPAESARRVSHPAPFPVDLPRRLIELFTYRGDLVLDPFVGSGSTAVAAVRTERHYIGFDTDAGYVELTERRLQEERRHPVGQRQRVTVPPRRRVAAPDSAQTEADEITLGHKARQLAHRTLLSAGFEGIEHDVTLGHLGLVMDFRARDATGAAWLFDLSGAYSTSRPGLRRPEVLWRSLGKATVVHEARRQDPDHDDLGPVILLSTELPTPRSGPGKALAAVLASGNDAPVTDAIELLDADAVGRLARYAGGDRHAHAVRHHAR